MSLAAVIFHVSCPGLEVRHAPKPPEAHPNAVSVALEMCDKVLQRGSLIGNFHFSYFDLNLYEPPVDGKGRPEAQKHPDL